MKIIDSKTGREISAAEAIAAWFEVDPIKIGIQPLGKSLGMQMFCIDKFRVLNNEERNSEYEALVGY